MDRSDSSSSTRRRFLHLVTAGGATVGAAALFGCGPSGPSGKIDAGNVSQLPVGSLRAVPSEAVAIGRDDKGVYAMTLICTHASCDMGTQGSVSPSGIRCSCHGSVFDKDGNVVQGPARA